MDSVLQTLLGVTLIIFMAGSLLEVGLKLKLSEAFGAIRNLPFVSMSLLWGFVLCPGLSILLTRLIPLPEPYTIGLIFLGMAPCAPFFPVMAEKAGGDLAYVAAFMALATVGTIIFMPVATPFLVPGFEAEPWTIAKPLLFYIGAPIGVLSRSLAEAFADAAHPIAKRVTAIDTLLMLALVLWIYGAEFLRAIGTYAIASHLPFCMFVAAAAYGSAFRLPHSQTRATSARP